MMYEMMRKNKYTNNVLLMLLSLNTFDVHVDICDYNYVHKISYVMASLYIYTCTAVGTYLASY